jgi:hypothetical protein
VTIVGYKFSLALSRMITDDESTILSEACTAAVFGTDSLPTNAKVTVTKMDFDDTESPGLAEAIESALEAVKKVPDLTVPGLTVPAQPAGPIDANANANANAKVVAGEVIEEAAAEVLAEEPVMEQAAARKPGTRKRSPRKPAASSGHAKENGAGAAADLVEATAGAS